MVRGRFIYFMGKKEGNTARLVRVLLAFFAYWAVPEVGRQLTQSLIHFHERVHIKCTIGVPYEEYFSSTIY